MIKRIQKQLQQPLTPISSAKGKENTAAVNQAENMHSTAGNVKKLAGFLSFGAGGRHSITDSPPNQNLAELTERIADNLL